VHQMKGIRVLIVALVALAAVAVAGSALATRDTPVAKVKPHKVKPQKVTVTGTEYHFAMARKTFKRGTVTFTFRNKGTEVHDFKVVGKSPKSRYLAPGQKQTFKIKFTKPGRYQFLCTIGEHAIKGMRGVLIIKK
jgi:plastocyanin